MKDTIYLDYAAATPLDDTALRVSAGYQQDSFYNPSALYQSARYVRQAIEDARGQVADVLGTKDQEIYFTAGGTEANNLAIHGVMNQNPNAHMLVSAIEHESVLEPARQYKHDHIPVTRKGIVDLEAVVKLILPNTVLISVMYANNEVGTIQPLKRLSKIVDAVRKQRIKDGNDLPLYIHTDACQAPNYLDLHVERLGVDLMTLNGGKIYSFKQTGCLYVAKHVVLQPTIQGGGQESGIRSGTENVGGITAFATMLQKVQKKKQIESQRISILRDSLFANISQIITGISLNGDTLKRLPNNLNILIPGIDGERAVLELDELGILAATGSACTASSDEPSHVLLALGLTEDEASASLRFTLGMHTTEAEIAEAATKIARAVHNSRLLV